MIQSREDLTAREREQMQHESEMFAKQAAHSEAVRQMEKDTKLAELNGRHEAAKLARESNERIKQAELELARLEARWLSWLRIPITIIRVPLYLILGIGLCISLARKHEPPKDFWALLR
jgi:hypothetical protein